MNGSPKRLRKSLAVLFAGILLLLGVFGPSVASADNLNPQVAPIQSQPYGQTYGQWSARWWQFAVQQTSLDFCAPGTPQSPVTFLAGTAGPPVTTPCTIPTGQSVMFPLFNVEWSVAEAQLQQGSTGQSCFVPGVPSGTDYAALLACATAGADHATRAGAVLAADVDGTKLQNLTHYRAVSPPPPFDVTAVDRNPFGIPARPTQAVADGFWIILTPLSAGTHTIHFSATVPFPELGFTFVLDQTYRLTVH
jgi:hypothetical protein